MFADISHLGLEHLRKSSLSRGGRNPSAQSTLAILIALKGLDCIAALRAFGEETRLRILRLLFQENLSVTEISEKLGVSQYNISKHLRIMREAGLLET